MQGPRQTQRVPRRRVEHQGVVVHKGGGHDKNKESGQPEGNLLVEVQEKYPKYPKYVIDDQQ